MQRHVFEPNPTIDDSCTALSDDGTTFCFESRSEHEVSDGNPFLDEAVATLRKNLSEDIQACLTFARQKRAWSNDRSLTVSVRREHKGQAQLWEARAEALRMALNGLVPHV